MSRAIKARTGPRRVGVTRARQELYATARQVDSAAAQVEMLADDDFVDDAQNHALHNLSRQLRNVADDIYRRVDEL